MRKKTVKSPIKTRKKEWDGSVHSYTPPLLFFLITRRNLKPVPSFSPENNYHIRILTGLTICFIQMVGAQCFIKDSPFTTSCTSVCACPKMFVAEHWYCPECLSCTFFKSNLPLETADLLTLDRLPLLLHTIAG